MKQRLGLGILLGLAMLLMVPAVSSAQSAIVGLLTDDSGGVLPGVSVEAVQPRDDRRLEEPSSPTARVATASRR